MGFREEGIRFTEQNGENCQVEELAKIFSDQAVFSPGKGGIRLVQTVF